jgi:hypothetical protein
MTDHAWGRWDIQSRLMVKPDKGEMGAFGLDEKMIYTTN